MLRRIGLLPRKADSVTKRISEKYTVMCHGNGLLLITTNETHANHALTPSTLPLLRCEMLCAIPPPPPPFFSKISCRGGECAIFGIQCGAGARVKKREDGRSRWGHERVP